MLVGIALAKTGVGHTWWLLLHQGKCRGQIQALIASELLSSVSVSDKHSLRENQFIVSFVSFKRDSFLVVSVTGE